MSSKELSPELKRVMLSDDLLIKYGPVNTLSDKCTAMLHHQKENWGMLADGYGSLAEVKTRKFEYDGFEVRLQFNPKRIKSTGAKVDKESIKKRKDFLALENLPEEQKGILYSQYFILGNPYPIFPEHLTIPTIAATPQRIEGTFDAMLNLAKDLQDGFTVFYNGPNCGASAPDHMHFQAGTKGFMPIDNEYERIAEEKGDLIAQTKYSKIYGVDKYIRSIFGITSTRHDKVMLFFGIFYKLMKKLQPNEDEPGINILASYQNDKWRVIFLPRAKHRPHQYFAEGNKKILVSPASVDLGGVCVTPREEDFEKIDKDTLADLMRQVSATKEYYLYLKKELTRAYEEMSAKRA